MNVIVTTPEELQKLISETVKTEVSKALQNRTNEDSRMKLYSMNQVRMILKIGHHKLKRLIEDGILPTTADGKISHSAITAYIDNQ